MTHLQPERAIMSILQAIRPTSTRGSGSRGARRAGTVAVALALVGAAACSASSVRPFFRPLPDALVDTLRVDPAVLTQDLAGLVAAEGFAIRWNSPAEGYLETEWFDVVERRPATGSSVDPARVVRLRFFADPVRQGETALVSEAVMRRTTDPSMPDRESESMVPPGHQGDVILRRILDSVTARYGIPAP